MRKYNLSNYTKTKHINTIKRTVSLDTASLQIPTNVSQESKSPRQQTTTQSIQELKDIRDQRKLTRKIMLLMSTYFICTIIYTPITFLLAFRVVGISTLFYCSVVIYLGNSVLNPIIYIIRDAQFRRKIKNMLGIRVQKVTVETTQTASS